MNKEREREKERERGREREREREREGERNKKRDALQAEKICESSVFTCTSHSNPNYPRLLIKTKHQAITLN